MFICFNDGIGKAGMGDTLQKAWENAQDNGVEAYEFTDCQFFEVDKSIEVEQTIVPATKVITQTPTQSKRK